MGIALRHGWAGVRARLCACMWLAVNLGTLLRGRAFTQSLRSVPDSEILTIRTNVLTPVETPVSKPGAFILLPLNTFMKYYYRLVLNLCRVFNG